jgi:hypothetical protein
MELLKYEKRIGGDHMQEKQDNLYQEIAWGRKKFIQRCRNNPALTILGVFLVVGAILVIFGLRQESARKDYMLYNGTLYEFDNYYAEALPEDAQELGVASYGGNKKPKEYQQNLTCSMSALQEEFLSRRTEEIPSAVLAYPMGTVFYSKQEQRLYLYLPTFPTSASGDYYVFYS